MTHIIFSKQLIMVIGNGTPKKEKEDKDNPYGGDNSVASLACLRWQHWAAAPQCLPLNNFDLNT